ncbi:molybdopterin synthase catalytic subunit MoaE [Chitinilyticum piscinae]|uniref:Molybdopterin synthase catalytic subunit n=1 Tax=Chitinilyticum piscinae TaxID=2866724 RepID=A0A8J7K1I6_9NEIS|nr:molybdopterin synthase catalytic subunit MoaE [Chitinilyticum piscinae]MBE9608737.1 molybdopterin synthase catalytic subunit MoaE [Chitinilyticum piscinae]
MDVTIRVQEGDFSLAEEYAKLTGRPEAGAVVAFVGSVRDVASGLASMTLEHYPGMTEKQLGKIVTEAGTRWPLSAVTLIHRVGELQLTEQIVLVLTVSAHRDAAFAANQFIMDYLKNEAPFWKKESTGAGEAWVEAKDSDAAALARWDAQ